MRQLDPAILLIDEASLRGAGYSLVRRMRKDTRLRWASLLVVRWDEIWSDVDGAAQIARTLGALATLAEPEHALKERIELGASFDTRLEITGPARLVRALAASARPIRAVVHNPRLQVRIETSDQLVAGARAQARDGSAPLDGAVALSALLVLGSGRVHIERVNEPEAVTIDVALSLADSEAPPIQPSLPAPESIRPEPAESVLAHPIDPSQRRRAVVVWAVIGLSSVLLGLVIAVLVVPPLGKHASARAAASGARQAADHPAAVSVPAVGPVAHEPSAPAVSAQARTAAPALARAKSEVADTSGEVTVKTRTCEEIVGPSWSLLGSDQPGRALSEMRLGRRALMLGKLDDAQVSFCRSAVLDPTRPEAYQALVRVLLLRKDATQACEWAERAAKQHPETLEVQGLYGDALARAGDADRARSIWLEGARIDPSDAASVRAMAYTYLHGAERSVKGADYAQADRLYRRAVLLDPLNATAAAGLARVLLVQSETDAALHWAKRAVSVEPHDAELHVLLGDVEEKVGDLAAARAEWRAAYDIDPHSFKAASRMLRIPK